MRFITSLVLTLFTLSAFAQNTSRQVTEQLMVDGMKRKIVTYIPAGSANAKRPLVISLHGGFATPNNMFHLADFRPLADKDQFLVICPASKRFWHDGADNDGIDDVKFIDQLISYAIKTYNADPARVYVTGISNGGFMTARLACQLSDRIAAVAIVAATMSIGEGYDLTRPMPALYMHGTEDGIVPYQGGKLFGRRIYSHDAVMDKWIKMNGCALEPMVTNIPDKAGDKTPIYKEVYSNPKTGVKVVSYTITKGGHTWPGGWQYLPRFIVGKTTRNLDACREIWAFFKQYKLSTKS